MPYELTEVQLRLMAEALKEREKEEKAAKRAAKKEEKKKLHTCAATY